jgi:glycosyltransferase involved in cell wall biosynthesis
MSKIKILVIPSDRTGVSYFRSTKPHIALEKLYPEEFHIDIVYEPKLEDDEWLKQYDLVHYHRTMGPYEKVPEVLERLNRLGIPSIMDLDDYWAPGNHHPAYAIIKNNKLDEKVRDNLKIAENVATTTSVFAEEISKLNKNVHVLPNAIDPEEKQFQVNPVKSDRIRIGWLGGSSHLKDLELLKSLVARLRSDGLMDKIQFVLCGFDLRGVKTIIDEKTGQQKQMKIQPKESVWYKYEQIFTDDYKTVSPEYKEHLLRFTKEKYEDVDNEPYRRVWTKPISSYASNYNLFDISLAPLVDNKFNAMKSQLKVIEAGFHKKALVAQDFGPYQIDLKGVYQKPMSKKEQPTFDFENGNAYLVDTSKNSKQWYQFVKKLINEPEQIEKLAENLHNTVTDLYSIEKVSETRRNLYKSLVKK